jgi:hypothetical protein
METATETCTVTDEVAAVTPKSILLKQCVRPSWAQHDQEWIPKSRIIECDQDVDEIDVGDEITIEIPLWLARAKGLAE